MAASQTRKAYVDRNVLVGNNPRQKMRLVGTIYSGSYGKRTNKRQSAPFSPMVIIPCRSEVQVRPCYGLAGGTEGQTLPDHEETIASNKTLINLHHNNVEKAQWRLFELGTGSMTSAGDEVAFSRSLIADEMCEIRKLEMLLKRLKHPQGKRHDSVMAYVASRGQFRLEP